MLVYSLYIHIDRDKVQLLKDYVRRNKQGAVVTALMLCGVGLFFGWDWISHHILLLAVFIGALTWFAFLLRPFIDVHRASRMMLGRCPTTFASRPVQLEECPLSEGFKAAVNALRKENNEVMLARIDASGRAWSPFGEFPFLPNVSAEEFVRRDRFDVDIVLCDNSVLIRKHFRGDLRHFAKEWIILEHLFGKARVPTVRKAHRATTTLYMDFICGRTILEILRDHGALMRDSDVQQDPRFQELAGEARQRALDAIAQTVLPKALPEHILKKLDKLIEDMHAAHVSDLDVRFANIILDRHDNPWFIDVHDARRYSPHSLLLMLKRDGDLHLYNRVFGRTLSTLKGAYGSSGVLLARVTGR